MLKTKKDAAGKDTDMMQLLKEGELLNNCCTVSCEQASPISFAFKTRIG